jgi:hypothetical protein
MTGLFTTQPAQMTRWRDYVRAGRGRITTTIAVLDRISRTRALTLKESLQLERAIKAEGYSERTWMAWTPEEDERARKLRADAHSYGDIARTLKRTPDAVAARLRYLRTKAANSSAMAAGI